MDILAAINALRNRQQGQGAATPEPDVARAGAEAISKRLPSVLMPRQAVEEDRRRKAMIDAQMRQAQ